MSSSITQFEPLRKTKQKVEFILESDLPCVQIAKILPLCLRIHSIPLMEISIQPQAYSSFGVTAYLDYKRKDYNIKKYYVTKLNSAGELEWAMAVQIISNPSLMPRDLLNLERLREALLSSDEAAAQAVYTQITLDKIYARLERGDFRPNLKKLGYASREELQVRVDYLLQTPLSKYSVEDLQELNVVMEYFVPRLAFSEGTRKLEFDVRYKIAESHKEADQRYRQKHRAKYNERKKQLMRELRAKRKKED